jgi:ABC-type glutathione transport system ATPase component
MSSTAPTTPLAILSIPTGQATISITVEAGKPIFILGRNGTGKSALVHKLRGMLGEQVVYLPGSRPNYFEKESLSITPASRRQLTANFKHWDSQPDTRWQSPSGTSRNEKAIHDLLAAETQYNVDAINEIKRDGVTSKAILRIQSDSAPLDRINTLLAQASLPIRTLIDAGEIKAKRDASVYSVAKTSDGERAALVLAAEVVSAADNTVFLIDEPELHLHSSIVVPLLSAFISEKPKCAFIISTHELDLPGSCSAVKIILVRGCTWHDDTVLSWDIDVLEDSSQIPESLRVDV